MKKSIDDYKQELKQKKKEAHVLHQVSEAINSFSDLGDLLNQVTEIVAQITKGDSCLLYLFDDHDGELVLMSSKNPHPKLIGRIKMEIGEGITGWVAKKGTPVAISKNASNDSRFKLFHNLPEDRYHAFLSVPVFAKDEVIGVINTQHKKSHKHSSSEVALVNTIAHQVGGAIEKAKLYDEMKKKAVKIETLSQVSKAIVSNKYLEEILYLIVTMTEEMMNSKICSIMLLDEEKKELLVKDTKNLTEEYRKKPNLKIGQGISGHVVKGKMPITVFDVTTETDYIYPELAKKEGLCSLLSVPMMIKDRVIGVINSYTAYPHKFSDEEIKIMQAVANQAAVAIENTRLFDKTVEMEEALETRKSVERAKGILAKGHNISEQEAFRLMQMQSMNSRKSMKGIAEAIILAAEIKMA